MNVWELKHILTCTPPPQYDMYVQSSEVEETLKRIQSHRGVEGVLIINSEGMTLVSSGFNLIVETRDYHMIGMRILPSNIA